MNIQSPIQVEFDEKEEVSQIVASLVDANNKNSNNFYRGFGDITFSDNIKAKVISSLMDTGVQKTIQHKLGFSPTIIVPIGDSRILKIIKKAASTKKVDITVYLLSSSLSANVTASKNLYVLNPYIFVVGDLVRVGSTSYKVESVDTSTRKVVIDTAINARQFDLVELYRDSVEFLIA